MSNIETVRAFCKAWESCAAEPILEFMTEDCFYHNIPLDPVVGRANIGPYLEVFLAMLEAAEFVVLAISEAADGAVLTERVDRFRMNGKSDWIELRVMGIFEFRDGRIANWRDYYDQAEMDRQMKLV